MEEDDSLRTQMSQCINCVTEVTVLYMYRHVGKGEGEDDDEKTFSRVLTCVNV